jgi:hypothetical protein
MHDSANSEQQTIKRGMPSFVKEVHTLEIL